MPPEDIDVGIVVPLRLEFDALTKVFGGRQRIVDDVVDLTYARPIGEYYRLTGPAGVTIVAVKCHNQGPEQAAIAVERLLHRYNVRLVCQTGIAGALSDDLKLGDVVVPPIIWGYHYRGKWTEDEKGTFRYVPGGEEWPASTYALNAVEVFVHDDDDGA